MNNVIAFIPARSQSQRIKDKNIYPLNGHPLIAYAICSALDSKIFDRVIVSTDSEKYAKIGRKYGAEIIIEPLPTGVGDIKWIKNVFSQIDGIEVFSILRPTSPFRTKETIQRAYELFSDRNNWYDSLRAVENCRQHPYKMWTLSPSGLKTLIECDYQAYNQPYQMLPEVYVQNASLEIAWAYCVTRYNSISGYRIRPFFTEGYEGFDINEPRDLREAEYLIKSGEAKLPEVKCLQNKNS